MQQDVLCRFDHEISRDRRKGVFGVNGNSEDQDQPTEI